MEQIFVKRNRYAGSFMKRFCPVILLLLAACGSVSYMRSAQPSPPPGPAESKVVVYQTMRIARTGQIPLYEYIDEVPRLIGFIERNHYFEYRCRPGKHVFLTWGEGGSYIEADLAGGLTYYLRTYADVGLFNARLAIAPVTRDTEEMRKLEGAWPALECRELDPGQASEYASYWNIPSEEVRSGLEEAKKDTRSVRPSDGRAERGAIP